MRLQRLKDKLGNRSNASCEVEFDGAAGWLLGDEGRGVQVIIEMVQHTRLDCAIGSAGIDARAPPRRRCTMRSTGARSAGRSPSSR